MALVAELFPLHRSICGEPLRSTLNLIGQHIPIVQSELPSGSAVLDWHVPQEWRIGNASICDNGGRPLVQYEANHLHLWNHSNPVNDQIQFAQLRPHLAVGPDEPQWIPFRTSYFRDDWGFSVSKQQYEELRRQRGDLSVSIDSELFEGSMTIGQCIIPGDSRQTILLFCHTCHPSLANDNCSGMAVATLVAKRLQERKHRYTYRIVFAPATIGSIAWLAHHREDAQKIRAGLILSLLGNDARFTYKRSRRHDALIDRVASAIVETRGGSVRSFVPFGYDERQFCSPGFDLPVGCLTRLPHNEFPEYHTSGDNLDFISGDRLEEAAALVLDICAELESGNDDDDQDQLHSCLMPLRSATGPVSQYPFGEPRLGKYDLHRAFGQRDDRGQLQEALMWVLNLSDGRHSIDRMSDRSGLGRELLSQAITVLEQNQLIQLP